MKTTLYMAMSVNGMVATKDGDEDFLADRHWMRLVALAKKHGNIIMGRRSYGAVSAWEGDIGFKDLADIEKVIVSRNGSFAPAAGFMRADSPQDAIDRLAAKGRDTALVVGGPTLAAAFADEELLDEIILGVEPVITPPGLPMIGELTRDLRLETISCENDDGLIVLRYRVLH